MASTQLEGRSRDTSLGRQLTEHAFRSPLSTSGERCDDEDHPHRRERDECGQNVAKPHGTVAPEDPGVQMGGTEADERAQPTPGKRKEAGPSTRRSGPSRMTDRLRALL